MTTHQMDLPDLPTNRDHDPDRHRAGQHKETERQDSLTSAKLPQIRVHMRPEHTLLVSLQP